MNKLVDCDFMDFLGSSEEKLDQDMVTWLKEQMKDYNSGLFCNHCSKANYDIVVYAKAILHCRDCGQYTEIDVDKISKEDYNVTQVTNINKLQEILTFNGE